MRVSSTCSDNVNIDTRCIGEVETEAESDSDPEVDAGDTGPEVNAGDTCSEVISGSETYYDCINVK